MSKTIIEIQDLTSSYDDHQVLKGINLSIREGERIVLLGPNGAGKSTLFLSMIGVHKPDAGKVTYRGLELNKKNLKAFRSGMGIVFQEADQQIIASSVRAEISFGPMNLGWDKAIVKKKVDQTLDQMQLTSFADRPPHYLSGGEKKRVTIADLVVMDTEVYLMDEPTASLDPVGAEDYMKLLEHLSKEGKTTLVSTHDVNFAYQFADRVLVLVDGQIVGDGSPDQIFGDQEILAKAHLKRPYLYEMGQIMKANGLLNSDSSIHSMDEFKDICSTLKEERNEVN